MLRSVVKPFGIKAVFLTHLHGDHCYGIPGLGMALLDQDPKLLPWLVTPRGLEQCFTGPMGLRGFKVRSVQRPASGGSGGGAATDGEAVAVPGTHVSQVNDDYQGQCLMMGKLYRSPFL